MRQGAGQIFAGALIILYLTNDCQTFFVNFVASLYGRKSM